MLTRDGRKCKRCAKAQNLHVHHRIAVQDGGTNAIDNLVTLCARCHKEWHYVEEFYEIPFDEWRVMPPYHLLYGVAAQILDFPTINHVVDYLMQWRERQ